jgi:membrane protein CcdC involved in cytochrome C biogenesis
MPPIPLGPVHPAILALVTLVGAAGMIAWRLRESRGEITPRKIVVPPLGMSTGFLMFLAPATRVPWTYASAAFAAGALVFSYPLARSSRLVRNGDAIVMQRSRAFLWILLGLVAVRLALRAWVEQVVSPAQTGALFFILAFGMVLRWRATMLLTYFRLRGEPAAGSVAARAPGSAEPR